MLQLAGCKRWPIYRPTRDDPLKGDAFEPTPAGAEPDTIETLEDGDVLYLPRGWIHSPLPEDEPSLHLTFAITRPTGAGFLAWLAKELETQAAVRASIPLPSDKSGLTQWKRRVSTIVQRSIEEGELERYLSHKDAERGARPRFSFPHFGRTPPNRWTEETAFRSSSLHRLVVESNRGSKPQVFAAGQAWPCTVGVARTLRRLTSTQSLTLGALEAGLNESDVAQLRQLLGMLVTLGLLEARSG